jgi:hypothetical protein
MTHVCVSTKRGTKGLVYAPDGRIIGHVRREWKDAAGTYGPHGPTKEPFFTANVCLDADRRGMGASLGTRHPTRASAMRAIRLFWDWYAQQDFALNARAMPGRFKSLHPEVCALKPRKVVS